LRGCLSKYAVQLSREHAAMHDRLTGRNPFGSDRILRLFAGHPTAAHLI
jgi:hypothetical protein